MTHQKIFKELQDKGFCFIDSFFSEAEVVSIKEELLFIYNSMPDYSALYDKVNLEENVYPYGKHLRMSSLDFIPEFKKIFLNKNFSPITQEYLGKNCQENLQIFSTYEYISENKSTSKPRNSYWHFDPYPALKYFIYLEDTTLNNGCLKVIPNTVSITKEIRKQIPFEKITGDGYKVEHLINNFKDQIVNLEGKKGSLIVFDTELFHVGSNLLSDDTKRMVIIAHNRP